MRNIFIFFSFCFPPQRIYASRRNVWIQFYIEIDSIYQSTIWLEWFMQSVWWRILFNLLFTSPQFLLVSFTSFKSQRKKFLTTLLNFHSRLLVSRARVSHDKNDDESKWKSCRKIWNGNSPTATAVVAAENCNEYNQNSSRIHFKFIINYRGFPLRNNTKEMENLFRFILRQWKLWKCFIQMNHVLVALIS